MLVKISDQRCPECRCDDIKSELRENLHTCGFWNEYRKFDCGLELHYCPNFDKVSVVHPCLRSKEFLRQTKEKDRLCDEVVRLIKSADLPEDYKKSFISDVRWKRGTVSIFFDKE